MDDDRNVKILLKRTKNSSFPSRNGDFVHVNMLKIQWFFWEISDLLV